MKIKTMKIKSIICLTLVFAMIFASVSVVSATNIDNITEAKF